MNKYKFKLLTSTGLGHEYFYCYGDEHFEQWLKRKNIKYEIDKKSINRFNKQKEILNKIKEELNNLYNADQSERNYKVFIEKVDKLLEEINERNI
jgi:hypothetical protein